MNRKLADYGSMTKAWTRLVRHRGFLVGLSGLAMITAAAATPIPAAEPPSLQSGTVIEAAERLKPGQFLWAPQIAPDGPVMLVVSLPSQRAVVYRNGVPIGISTVSTGRRGYETPTGIFVILQKHIEHYSSTYDNAPMPYMQRLTWKGIALHAGNLPGYPASHGCIRLPREFARLLYGVTHRGMTVVVTKRSNVPRVAPIDELITRSPIAINPSATISWNPEKAPRGPLSVIISAADKRLIVLRNGVAIGSAPVEIDGGINRTTAYVLNGVVDGKRAWAKIALPGQEDDATEMLRGRVRVAEPFRSLVDPALTIGTTVIVTGDTLHSGQSGQPLTLIENETGAARPPK